MEDEMTTPRTRPIVSLAVWLSLTLALGACVRSRTGPAPDVSERMTAPSLAIRFDNDAREHVHVYLIGDRREWLLGRIEAGTRKTLEIPAASRAAGEGFVRLAVIAGERPTLQAARNPRAIIALAQPATEIVAQRWTLTHGQLTSLPVPREQAEAGAPW
jgi:hypothetical protein